MVWHSRDFWKDILKNNMSMKCKSLTVGNATVRGFSMFNKFQVGIDYLIPNYSKNRNMNIDFLNMIKYYDINEHEQNGVDEEEYILT